MLKIPVFNKCFDLRGDSVNRKLPFKKINYVFRIWSTKFLKIEVSTVTVDEYNESFAIKSNKSVSTNSKGRDGT